MTGADQHIYIAFSVRAHSNLRQEMEHRSLFQSMKIASPAQNGMSQSFLWCIDRACSHRIHTIHASVRVSTKGSGWAYHRRNLLCTHPWNEGHTFQNSLFILIETMTESIQKVLHISDKLVNEIYMDFYCRLPEYMHDKLTSDYKVAWGYFCSLDIEFSRLNARYLCGKFKLIY